MADWVIDLAVVLQHIVAFRSIHRGGNAEFGQNSTLRLKACQEEVFKEVSWEQEKAIVCQSGVYSNLMSTKSPLKCQFRVLFIIY
jgi:hypothetical protein